MHGGQDLEKLNGIYSDMGDMIRRALNNELDWSEKVS